MAWYLQRNKEVNMQSLIHPFGELLYNANGKHVSTFFDSNVWSHVRYYGDQSELGQIIRLLECLSDVSEIAKVELYLFQVLEHQAADHARKAVAEYWKNPDQSPYDDFLAKAQSPVIQPEVELCPGMSFRRNYNGFGFDVSGTGHVRFTGPIHGMTGAPFDVNVFAYVSNGKLTPLYQGVKRRVGKAVSDEHLLDVWTELRTRFLKAVEEYPYLPSKMEIARTSTLALADRMRSAMAPRISDAIMMARDQIDLPDELLYGKLKSIGLEAMPTTSPVPKKSAPANLFPSDQLALLALEINDAITENAFSWNTAPDMWNWRRKLSSQVAHKQILQIALQINDIYSRTLLASEGNRINPSFTKAMLQEFDFSTPGSITPQLRNGLNGAYEAASDYLTSKNQGQRPR
jgi:hypothetical protein